MKTRFLKFALLAVFCLGTAVANAQASGYTEVRKANIVKEPIASFDIAVKTVGSGKVIVILDGIEISQEKFKSLNPNNIEKMELQKGETMKVLYGEKAANGVLFITSKRENSQEVKVAGFTSVSRGKVATEKNVLVSDRGSVANTQTKLSEEVINLVKGLKTVDTKGLSADEAQTVMKVLNQIKRENSPRLEMLNVHHRGSQMCYPCVELAGMKVDAISIAEKPLFILNGKEISIEEFNGLNPSCVVDLRIIRGEEATKGYGEKAANGVLLITTKKDCTQQKIDNEDVEIIYNGKVISKEEAEKMGIFVNVIVKEIKDNQQQIVGAKCQRIAEMQQCRAAQQQSQGPIRGFMSVRTGKIDTKNIDSKEEAAQLIDNGKFLILLNGIEISEEKCKSLDPNSIEKLEFIKDETMKVLYGEKAAGGVLMITSKKVGSENTQSGSRQAAQQQSQGPVQGFMSVRAGKMDTKYVDSKEEAVQLIDNGKVLIILDGIEISEEKFKSLDPNSIERLELIKGETMKVLYGKKTDDGMLMITSKKSGSENAQRVSRRANTKNVHRVTKADLKPIDSATKLNAISIYEPKLHVRGSMARIENINSDELPVISKFKQNGNQVSFRIEIPKSETTKKQKFDIQYTLPTEM